MRRGKRAWIVTAMQRERRKQKQSTLLWTLKERTAWDSDSCTVPIYGKRFGSWPQNTINRLPAAPVAISTCWYTSQCMDWAVLRSIEVFYDSVRIANQLGVRLVGSSVSLSLSLSVCAVLLLPVAVSPALRCRRRTTRIRTKYVCYRTDWRRSHVAVADAAESHWTARTRVNFSSTFWLSP